MCQNNSPLTVTLMVLCKVYMLLLMYRWYSPESVVSESLMVREPVWWSGCSLPPNLLSALSYNENWLASFMISAIRWSSNFHIIWSYPRISITPVRRMIESPFFTDTVFISSVTGTNTYREQMGYSEAKFISHRIQYCNNVRSKSVSNNQIIHDCNCAQ